MARPNDKRDSMSTLKGPSVSLILTIGHMKLNIHYECGQAGVSK